MSLPLEDTRILSMAWMAPGPYCTMLLADLGADVIMLEQPRTGDPSRMMGLFPAFNRNKRSIAVNLRSARGREAVYRLAQKVDVITEGFRPGTAKRLGIDYETIRAMNPRVVYASISGFGQDGAYRDRPGHDLTYQGMAGMLASQVSALAKGAALPLCPVPIADLSAGMFACIGILAALCARKETGQGQYIDVSMSDGLVSWMSLALAQLFSGREGATFAQEPSYGVFETRDGKHITLSIAFEDHFWRNLCIAIDRPSLQGLTYPERVLRREEITAALRETLLAKTRDEWVKILAESDVPSGPVNEPGEVLKDPHFQERGLFGRIQSSEGTWLSQIAFPIRFSGMSTSIRRPPPDLGQHTEEILLSLGYRAHEVKQLLQELDT